MRENRSASQILFGFLPDQTVDIGGGVWKVKRWNDAEIQRNVDTEALRQELIRLSWRWEDTQKDGGFVNDLRTGKQIVVKSLNRERGIWCEPFPEYWLCNQCKRVHDTARGTCECGFRGRRGQLPFVGYHDACGNIKPPWIRKCRTHNQVAVRFPGTASSEEIVFYCPICNVTVKRGFAGATCDCAEGGMLKFTVHRAASVYTPRPIVIVNPPRRDSLDKLRRVGGAIAAMDWVLRGFPGRWVDDADDPSGPDATRRVLLGQGLAPEMVEKMVAAMGVATTKTASSAERLALLPPLKEEAEAQAQMIALALQKSRITLADLEKAAPAGSVISDRYLKNYRRELRRAGIERLELIDEFPVLTGQYGYTRGDQEPGASRLKTFRERDGSYTIYADVTATEAMFVRLSPVRVAEWLIKRGCNLPKVENDEEASTEILRAIEMPRFGDPNSGNEVGRLVTNLIHSFAHRFIRQTSVFAGIERSALSELLVPLHLGFFVYAAARGDFVLGGLQALFETELDELLHLIVDGEHRCAMDPGCSESGSACAICIHLGEPSCRMFNTMLSREVLAGGQGYFDVPETT